MSFTGCIGRKKDGGNEGAQNQEKKATAVVRGGMYTEDDIDDRKKMETDLLWRLIK